MRAKKKPAPAMKKTTRQPRKRKTIPISPMHSSAEEYAGDSDPVEEIQQVHSCETEPVAITAMVITGGTTGPTSTATTTPTASISTATSASASLSKKSRSSGFLSEEDEDKMIEWLQENRFIYDMKSKIYKDKSSKTTAWQTQAENLGFEGTLNFILNCLLLMFIPYPEILKGKITSATDATVDDASSSIADEESTQDMQHRHDEDIADINMVLDGREDPVATHTTISLEQMPPSS
ncbi:unnamed protein product [Mytilus edulis]|uniref:MADF domain-containing protein n=1 Tax=Mytilus edulis TaxID=6550 RepID=A0A8S3TAR6_MYTED|nr:unnamed protein product [Mytilus edulis]